MDYNNNDGSNLDNNNSNDYPNNTYNNNNMNDYNDSSNGSYNENDLGDSFNENFNNNNFNNNNFNNNNCNGYNNNNFNNGYNNNFNNPNNNTPNPSNGFAIASLVLGIVSIPLACCYGFGIITAIIGIIMGIVSKKHNGRKMPGMAVAGIICSVLGIITSIFAIIYYVIIFSTLDLSTTSEIFKQFESSGNFY